MNVSELQSSEYHIYYKPYIEILGDVRLMEELERGSFDFIEVVSSIPEASFQKTYQSGKWTIAELLMHILDTERIFQYRALRFARNDATELPGFEQDVLITYSNANKRKKEDIKVEYQMIRGSTLTLYKHLSKEDLLRKGIASNSPISVRALGFLICGHQKHHLKILQERYL
ncbi:DinB family protein [Flavobacteriaceae bacterium M23B6Z8]